MQSILNITVDFMNQSKRITRYIYNILTSLVHMYAIILNFFETVLVQRSMFYIKDNSHIL